MKLFSIFRTMLFRLPEDSIFSRNEQVTREVIAASLPLPMPSLISE